MALIESNAIAGLSIYGVQQKDYTVKVEVQLGTGERPVVWEGKLAQ